MKVHRWIGFFRSDEAKVLGAILLLWAFALTVAAATNGPT